MAGIASLKGEQAKTDTDRIKKSLVELRQSWRVEDREFNAYTIRAYRFDKLSAEIFTFSLAPNHEQRIDASPRQTWGKRRCSGRRFFGAPGCDKDGRREIIVL